MDFEAQMGHLREAFATMASRCRGQLKGALEAFWTRSAEQANAVKQGDREIDDDEKAIDELLLSILALRHPVASDLRMVTACFKLVTDLERVGDEAVEIARAAPAGPVGDAAVVSLLRGMATATETMLDGAIGAFLARDDAAAARVLESGNLVDTGYLQVVRDVGAYVMAHPGEAAAAIGTMSVARCLERIASHATNIASGARFAVRDEAMPR
jgi:phosphate transport system protein